MNRMLMRLIPLLAVVAIIAPGCAKAPPAKARLAATSQPAAVTTIRMAMWASHAPIYDPVISAFQDKHPVYRVETVPFNNLPMLEDLIRNGRVDLIPNTLTWDRLFGIGKAPISIDPYIAKTRFDTAPFGPLLDGEVVGGRHYGLPVAGYPFVFAYNKRLVAAAGVTIPTDSWTWAEFREAAARLTSGTGDTKIWGFDWSRSSAPENLAYMILLEQMPSGGMPDSRAFREVLSFFETMVKVDKSMPPRPVDFGEDPPQPYCDMGRAALCLVPFPLLSSPAYADFSIAPLPVAPQGKPMMLASVGSYGIAAAAQDPDAAWALLSFMAGPEGALLLAAGGQVPVYSTEATRQAWSDSPAVKPPGWESVLRAPWYVPPTVTTEVYSPYGALLDGAAKILDGTGTVDQAVAFYEKILKEAH